MSDPAAMLKLQQELVAMGVPRATVARALQHIEDGGSARDAYEICVAGVPELSDALLLEVQAERLVLRAEIAVRDRQPVPVLARRRRNA